MIFRDTEIAMKDLRISSKCVVKQELPLPEESTIPAILKVHT